MATRRAIRTQDINRLGTMVDELNAHVSERPAWTNENTLDRLADIAKSASDVVYAALSTWQRLRSRLS